MKAALRYPVFSFRQEHFAFLGISGVFLKVFNQLAFVFDLQAIKNFAYGHSLLNPARRCCGNCMHMTLHYTVNITLHCEHYIT
jgi:hypothetical protein